MLFGATTYADILQVEELEVQKQEKMKNKSDLSRSIRPNKHSTLFGVP